MTGPVAVPAVSVADRATQALTGKVSAAEARKLWNEVVDERDAQAERLSQAEDAAVDPLVSTAAAVKLRAEADAMQFSLDRLDRLRDALGRRVDELQSAEKASDGIAEYDAAEAERDEVTDSILMRYPQLVAELIDIASRVRASNERILAVNSRLPKGKDWLSSAEAQARGRPEHSNSPSIVKDMRLPAVDDSPYFAWPPSFNEIAAADISAKLAKALVRARHAQALADRDAAQQTAA